MRTLTVIVIGLALFEPSLSEALLQLNKLYRQAEDQKGVSHLTFYAYFHKDGSAQVYPYPQDRSSVVKDIRPLGFEVSKDELRFYDVPQEFRWRPSRGKILNAQAIEIRFTTELFPDKESLPMRLELVNKP